MTLPTFAKLQGSIRERFIAAMDRLNLKLSGSLPQSLEQASHPAFKRPREAKHVAKQQRVAELYFKQGMLPMDISRQLKLDITEVRKAVKNVKRAAER